MDLDILREYLVFTKYLNITKASENLHLAPSSLSRHISLLEKEVGIPLVTHSKPIKLTAAGLVVLNETSKILSMYDEMIVQAADSADTPYSDIKIAFLQEDRAVVDRIMLVLSKARHLFPSIDIGQAAIQNMSFLEALEKGEADISILFEHAEIDEKKFLYKALLPDSLVAALPKNGAFKDRSKVSIFELENLTLFQPAPKQFDDFHSLALKIFARHGVKLNHRYISANTIDEFYTHDADDRVWFFAKTHIVEHQGSVPISALENSVICEIEEDGAHFMRYAAYRKDESNKGVSLFADLLTSNSTT